MNNAQGGFEDSPNKVDMSQVKQTYRPDWIDSDNKIFINKLNFICEHYDKTHSDIKKLRNTVFKNHKADIEDLFQKQKDHFEDYKVVKEKVVGIEDNLAQMIREMINYYFDQRFEVRFDQYVTKKDFKERMSYKMDYALFREYQKKDAEREAMDNKSFIIDEKFTRMDKQIRGLVSNEHLDSQVATKAPIESFVNLEKIMEKFRTKTEENQANLQKKYKQLQDDFSSRTGQLQDYITQIESKLKELDDELGGSKSGRTMSHHSKTQTGSIKSKTRSRRSASGNSLRDIDDVNELEVNQQDSEQRGSDSKSKHSQSQVVQSSKKSSVASLKEPSQSGPKSKEHTRSKGLEEMQAESSHKPSIQQSLKGINEGDASGTLNVAEKTSHHTQSIQHSNKYPPSPTSSVRYEKQKTQSKDARSKSRHTESPLKVASGSPTHVKSSDQEIEVLAEKSKSIKQEREAESPQQVPQPIGVEIQLKQTNQAQESAHVSHSSEVKDSSRKMLKAEKNADQGTLLNIDTAGKRESPEKDKESPRQRRSEAASPTLSFKKQEKESKSPSHRDRRTVKRFKDEEKHDQSSVGDSPYPRPDSPASIVKSVRSRESRKKSHRKKRESDEERNADRIQLNLGGDSPRLAGKNDELIMAQQKRLLEQVGEFKRELIMLQKAFNACQEQVNHLDNEVNTVNNMDPGQKLDRIKRRLIEEVLNEKMTPIRRDMNVDLKQLRKYIEECMSTGKEHAALHKQTQSQIDQMNVTILRQLKNTDNENKLLDRELQRMQHIDRIKVSHARSSIYNPDVRSVLPTLDTLDIASKGNTPSVNLDQNSVKDQLPIDGAYSTSREVITANETKGHCERFNTRPSQRQRIIIARSQEQQYRGRNLKSLNNTHQHVNNFLLNQSIHNDSIMSATNVVKFDKTPGTAGRSSPAKAMHNQLRGKQGTRGSMGLGTIDVQNTHIPDAMIRIKMKQNQNYHDSIAKKKKMAQQLESARGQVLGSYNIKTII